MNRPYGQHIIEALEALGGEAPSRSVANLVGEQDGRGIARIMQSLKYRGMLDLRKIPGGAGVWSIRRERP